MQILFVVEKPHTATRIAPHVRAKWPNDTITFVMAVPFGNIRFRYPRGLHWSQFPVISSPQYTFPDTWTCLPAQLSAQEDTLKQLPMSLSYFHDADVIINACDPDATGAVSFEILMNLVFGDDRAHDCPALELVAFDQRTIEQAIEQMQPFHSMESITEYGRTKRYFDWNWNVNALAILGATARRAGVAAGAPPISKYALQLLYGMQNLAPQTDGPLVSLMAKWPGTGKYKMNSSVSLGSVSSYVAILDNLLSAELLVKKDGIISLGDKAHHFLRLLHPDCIDLDLPFRLDEWCSRGMEKSKPAMDRYLKTFFGKQQRFLG